MPRRTFASVHLALGLGYGGVAKLVVHFVKCKSTLLVGQSSRDEVISPAHFVVRLFQIELPLHVGGVWLESKDAKVSSVA